MKTVSVWSRSRLFLPGAGAGPIWSEPESAPVPRTSGAAQKSGGSATLSLLLTLDTDLHECMSQEPESEWSPAQPNANTQYAL